METKLCKKCSIEKTLDLFRVRNGKLFSYCRQCECEINKELRARKKKEKLEKDALIKEGKIEAEMKKCKSCGEEKLNISENFRPQRGKCLDCERASGRGYRTSEHGQEKSKQWNEENSERMKELQANYYMKNKKIIREKQKERYYNDPNYKLKKKIQRDIQLYIHHYINFGFKKNENLEFLNCNHEILIKWIKFSFQEGFTFGNYPELWHVDHVIPLGMFDLSDDSTHNVLNWRNISPLKGKENMNKKANIKQEQLQTHYTKLIEFHNIHNIKFPNELKEFFARHLIMTGTPLES